MGKAIFFKLVAYVWRFSCRRKAWLGVLCSRPSRAQSPKGEDGGEKIVRGRVGGGRGAGIKLYFYREVSSFSC